MLVAHLVVPGSPIDREDFLVREILPGANKFLIGPFEFLLFGVLYLTLFARIYPRLPAGLRLETVCLKWMDLRLTGALCVMRVIVGLLMIV